MDHKIHKFYDPCLSLHTLGAEKGQYLYLAQLLTAAGSNLLKLPICRTHVSCNLQEQADDVFFFFWDKEKQSIFVSDNSYRTNLISASVNLGSISH